MTARPSRTQTPADLASMRDPKTLLRWYDKVDWPDTDEECFNWTAYTDREGYGQFKLNGRDIKAHRLALMVKLGRPLADDEWALHSCHNPRCVNPAHLRIGNHQDNMDDMVEAERQSRLPGEVHGMATLAEAQVVRARKVKWADPELTWQQLVDLVAPGTPRHTMRDAVTGRTWRYLDGEHPPYTAKSKPSRRRGR